MGGNRGWADRVAEELGRGRDSFAYANLAVRGRLLQQIADQQVGPALMLKPDLISISAGGNDLIRPGGDPDAIAARLDGVVGILRTGGTTVLMLTGPDTRDTPVLGSHRCRDGAGHARRRTHASPADPQTASAEELADRPLGGSGLGP